MEMEIVVYLEAANVLLLLSLLFIYIQNYRGMKTSFGLGLIVFAGFLLVQNAMAVYFHVAMIDFYSSAVMDHTFYLTIAQTIGLAALTYVSWTE